MSDTSALSLVERLTTEGLIGMRLAAAAAGQKHGSTPTRWAVKGFKRPDGTVLKLEAIRSGGRLMTSRAAVNRFLAAQNIPDDSSSAPTIAPPRRTSAASKKVSRLLATSGRA